MSPIVAYLKIKCLSSYRIFKEFPLPIRLILLPALILIGYVLSIQNIAPSVTNYLYCLGAFLVIGKWLCGIHAHESILVKSLGIPLRCILVLKCMLLGIPFMLLNGLIGGAVVVSGSFILYILSSVNKSFRFALPSFYMTESYQWLSSWRAEGVWGYLLGLFLTCMGLYSGNRNLIYFSLLCTSCLSCFFIYYRMIDPLPFLTIYKNPSCLIQKKTVELLVNTSLSLAVSVILLLLFLPIKAFPILWIAGGILGNCLLLYTYYCCYPSMLKALIVLCSVLIVLTAIGIENPLYGLAALLLLLPTLYFIAHRNLKSILYVNATPEDRTTTV